MKTITLLLWLQVIFGGGVALVAFGHIHTAAMGMDHSRTMQRDFEQLKQSPGFQEPPPVQGHSYAGLIEDRYTAAHERGNAALLALVSGIAMSLLAAGMLWLLRRVKRQKGLEFGVDDKV